MAEHVAVKCEGAKVVPTRDTIQTRSCQNMKGLTVSELCASKASHGPCKEMTAMSFLPLVTRFEMIQSDTFCDVTTDSAWSERDIKQFNSDRAYCESLKQDISDALYEDPSLLSIEDCCTNLEPMDLREGLDSNSNYIESNIEIVAEPPMEGHQMNVKTEGIDNHLETPEESLAAVKEAIFHPPFDPADYEQSIPIPQPIEPGQTSHAATPVQKCIPHILKKSSSQQHPMTFTVNQSPQAAPQIILHSQCEPSTHWMEQGEKIAQPTPVTMSEMQAAISQSIPIPSSLMSQSAGLYSTSHLPSIVPKPDPPLKAAGESSKTDSSSDFLQFVKDIQYVSKDSQGNESFKCTMCPKVYLSLNAFKAHASTHFKGTNTCGVCGKQFSRSWLLKGHMRTHTGERPFACTYDGCTKAFADRSNLRSHMLIHSAASGKGYRCEQCQRVFAQKRYLHKHMQEVCKVFPDDSSSSSSR